MCALVTNGRAGARQSGGGLDDDGWRYSGQRRHRRRRCDRHRRRQELDVDFRREIAVEVRRDLDVIFFLSRMMPSLSFSPLWYELRIFIA